MMKKLLTSMLGLIICGMTTHAAADDYCCYDPCNTSDYCCSPDGKFFVCADWLYWKMDQSNDHILEFQTTESALDGTISISSATREEPLRPNHKWDNGFRVCAGYVFPCNCWDINVSYYNLRPNVKRSFTADLDAGEAILYTNLVSGLDDGLFTAPRYSDVALKWNSNLQNADIDFGRVICFGECFKLRPHIGARATWMDQKYLIAALGEVTGLGSSTVATASEIKQNFQGYGIEGGLWASWEFCSGFSLVGHFGGSLLYTKFNIHNRTASTETSTFGTFTTTNNTADEFKDNFFTGLPSLEYFIGLKYASCLFDMELSAHVGWEQHVWFDANQFVVGLGNLYTQGLTAGISVGF